MHAPAAHAVPVAPIDSAIVRAINVVRADDGLRPVRLSRTLTRVALGHTRDMLTHQLMTHAASDGTSFAARMAARLTGLYSRVGETIFWEAVEADPTADSIVQAWMDSPPHRAQLLDRRYRAVGVATVTGDYQGTNTLAVTADFGVHRRR
jgi:uncharacterized protein YkwD